MVGDNYDDELWPLIYDQYNSGRHDREYAFYESELHGCRGPVLEAACGTGMILLKLLGSGFDAYGFDLSSPMLDALFGKAEARHYPDIRARVTRQNLVDFRYDFRFDAICIPARSFLHLMGQDDQIGCLRNAFEHLKPGGRLLLNFFNPNLSLLVARAAPTTEYQLLMDAKHPRTGQTITVSCRQRNDILQQTQDIDWRFVMDGREHGTKMRLRWIYKQEFELLLRLAGFSRWRLFGDFARSECTSDSQELIWIAERSP